LRIAGFDGVIVGIPGLSEVAAAADLVTKHLDAARLHRAQARSSHLGAQQIGRLAQLLRFQHAEQRGGCQRGNHHQHGDHEQNLEQGKAAASVR
jgi:hypothetical protein